MSEDAADLAARVVEQASAKGLTVALAESCTGGLVCAALTGVAGASAVLTHGVVAYANEAKAGLLGVPAPMIARHGAVSGEVARAMAQGVRRLSKASLAVSITGIAGPGGGSADKPVGLVWFGVDGGAGPRTERQVFPGDRTEVRARACRHALRMILGDL